MNPTWTCLFCDLWVKGLEGDDVCFEITFATAARLLTLLAFFATRFWHFQLTTCLTIIISVVV